MRKEPIPPHWVDSLLDELAPHDLAEEIKGDLYEMFREDVSHKGVAFAKGKYALNAIGFLTKSFFWRKRSYDYSNPFIMLSSYFKMARRSLLAFKSNTVINIFGLVTGIASALVIFSVIRYELSFDSYHSDADRIYRIVRVTNTGPKITKDSECRTGISFPVPYALKQEATAIEKITTVQFFGTALVEVPDASGTIVRRFNEQYGCTLAEPSFFSIFDYKGTTFKWLAGSAATSLEKPYSVVLTRSIAAKYFPEGNAMGKTLKFNKRIDCTVTGITEDFPPNTDLPFTLLVSYSTLPILAPRIMDDWSSVDDNNCSFIVPAKGATVAEVERQIAKAHAAHTPKDLHESRYYLLQTLDEMHFDPRFGNFNGRTITKPTLLALGIIAVFLLLTGSINYINLATAQSTMRSKEIGLRKVMGSNRKNLVFQFLTETFLVVFVAGVIALGLSELLQFKLQSLLNLSPDIFYFADPIVLGLLFIIILAVTLFSGLYPSLVISRFNPVASLKNKFSTETIGGFSLRKMLVVAQFTITQMLVVGTFVVVAQMRFFRDTDIGFVYDAVVNVTIPDRDDAKRETLVQQFRAQSFVSAVSCSYNPPGGSSHGRNFRDISRMDTHDNKDVKIYEFQSIDTAFLKLYKIKLLAGRNFQQTDSSHYLLINKTLMKELGLGTPEEALGVSLREGDNRLIVIGVVDNFYSESLKSPVGNIAMMMRPSNYREISIKLTGQQGKESLTQAVAKIEAMWKTTYPEYIFEYSFLDNNIKAYYIQEEKYAQLFELFSFTFMLIGCLGLLGLITFVINRKGKEIAIRKVMGASVPGLLLMFSKEYIKLIAISFLLAVPVTYYVVNDWLSNFSTHISLQWWLFAIPGAIVLGVAIVVVCAKSMGAANRNPVESLKCE